MNHHPLLIVPLADRDRANSAAVQITGNPDDAFTFDVPLCAAGDPEQTPTHFMAAPEVTEERYQTIITLWQQGFPNARVFDATLDSIGTVLETALSELGLKRISHESP